MNKEKRPLEMTVPAAMNCGRVMPPRSEDKTNKQTLKIFLVKK